MSPELKIDDVSSFMTGAESDLENSLKMLSISDVKHDLYDNRGSNRYVNIAVLRVIMTNKTCYLLQNWSCLPSRYG